MKIRPAGAALLLSDRRADVTELIVAFRSPANTPQKKQIPNKMTNIYVPLKYMCTRAARRIQQTHNVVKCHPLQTPKLE